MIVKNEEDLLEDCLSWHKDLVDEIIIVDTGSTDRSKEIAKKYTSNIFDFQWCDDFSAARNYSLSLAKGDWILVLDADEKLSPEDQTQIRKLVEHSPPEAYQFIQRTYSNNNSIYGFKTSTDFSSQPFIPKTLGYFDIPIVRLISNIEELQLRYVQRIHEGIEYKDSEKKPLPTGIILHHYGALKKEEQLLKKKKFYYELEKIRFQENEQDPEGLRQYGNACLEFEEWQKALECFEKAQELEQNHSYHFFGKALAFYHLKNFEECEACLKKGLLLHPDNDYLLRFLSILLMERNKNTEAELHLQNYISKHPLDVELKSQFVSRYMQQGQLQKALNFLNDILKINPYHQNSLYNAGVLFKHLGQDELALEAMQKLLELKPEDEEVKQKIINWKS